MTNLEKPTCRNCGGLKFFSHDVSAGGGMGLSLLPIGFFVGARYTIRVCGACGLTEWFVPEEFLRAVRETFQADH